MSMSGTSIADWARLPSDQRTRSRAWDVTLATDPRSLLAEWNLLEAQGHATLFQRSEWVLPWYRAAAQGGSADPLVVAVRRPSSDVVVMLLPLCRRCIRGLDVVEFADLSLSDYTAPIFAPVALLSDEEATDAMHAALAAIRCDVMRFGKITPVVGGRRNPMLSLPGAAVGPLAAYGLALQAPFGEHASQVFDKSFHRDLKRVMRKLSAERGEPRLIVAETREQARSLFDTFLAQRSARFEAIGRMDTLATPAWRAFYANVFASSADRSFGTILALAVGDEIVAVDLAVLHNDAICLLAGSFLMEEGWRKYSLGNVLTYLEMEWATARGIKVFDLTIGAEAYKLRFGVREIPLHEWTMARSWRGAAEEWAWRLKGSLRKRPRLHAAARRLLRRPSFAG
jgi:CelD/BcsL family acetyltransferase involved in cellulose biosynthesis